MHAQELMNRLKHAIEYSKQPCIVRSAPGVGKTSIVKQAARECGYSLLYWHLVQKDAIEIGGLPMIDKNGRTTYAMPADFPDINAGKVVWLLDELPQAPMMVQNTMSEPVLERTLRGVPMSPDAVIIATGNKREHKSGVHEMGMHMRNRFWHADLEVSVPDWITWAYSAGIEETIIGFMHHLGEKYLSTFDVGLDAFASPRTWEMLSRELSYILGNFKVPAPDGSETEETVKPRGAMEILNGYVGEGAGTAFWGFLRLVTQMPDPDECIRNPLRAPLPDKAAIKYSLMVALAARMTPKTAAGIFAYLDRIDDEFAVVCVKDALIKDRSLLTKTPEGQRWVQKHKDAFL